MKVLYKCKCIPKEVEVCVPNRIEGTHIEPWMACVTGCIAYDHSARTPECREQKMEYVKIHIHNNGSEIGVPPESET